MPQGLETGAAAIVLCPRTIRHLHRTILLRIPAVPFNGILVAPRSCLCNAGPCGAVVVSDRLCRFVLICPWLNIGLKAIGRAGHGFIAVLGVVMWGVLPYVAKGMDLSAFMFIYLYIPMAYLRWYRSDLERSRLMAWALTLGGLFVSSASYAVRKILIGSFTYGVDPWYLPSMCAALGIILLTTQARPRHSRVINAIAKSTLAVYLVHLNWGIFPLWQNILSCILIGSGLSNQPWMLFVAHFTCVVLLYLFIVVIDMIRRKLFNLTINRLGHENRWFNRVWMFLIRFSPKLAQNNL